jgi:hypothetical protein
LKSPEARIRLLVFAALVSVGCGYFVSGTWEDDPGNWGRAFQSTKPPDVVVVHSKYWRSPHWSYEFEYYFEIAPNAGLKRQLFSANKLRRVTGSEAEKIRGKVLPNAPAWFAPKRVAEYEVWVFDNEPDRHFKLLIDSASGQMFLHDYAI